MIQFCLTKYPYPQICSFVATVQNVLFYTTHHRTVKWLAMGMEVQKTHALRMGTAKRRKQGGGKKYETTRNWSIWRDPQLKFAAYVDIPGGVLTYNGKMAWSAALVYSWSIPKLPSPLSQHNCGKGDGDRERERAMLGYLFCARASLASGPFSCSVVARQGCSVVCWFLMCNGPKLTRIKTSGKNRDKRAVNKNWIKEHQ